MLLRLDPSTHTLEVLNAGHNPAFLVDTDGTATKIAASGTPIGILPFSSYQAQKLILSPGMRLLVYTDGMTEVFCGDDEFGERRLLETFLACKEPTPERALGFVWSTLESFSDGQEQSDDMTALTLFRNP
jgi:serine phosphatase RsbU (regulator of sigma subunit)